MGATPAVRLLPRTVIVLGLLSLLNEVLRQADAGSGRRRLTALLPGTEQQCAEAEQQLVDEGNGVGNDEVQQEQAGGEGEQPGKPQARGEGQEEGAHDQAFPPVRPAWRNSSSATTSASDSPRSRSRSNRW